jgi:hypothetical protein
LGAGKFRKHRQTGALSRLVSDGIVTFPARAFNLTRFWRSRGVAGIAGIAEA